MGTRPLRQHYDGSVEATVSEDLGDVATPWRRHRARFLDELAELSEDEWRATTRCDAWDAREVVLHLVTADSFWAVSLSSAASGAPTRFLADFDPSTSPDALIEPMRAMTGAEVLERFRAGTDAFVAAVDAVQDWSAPGESPMGHVPATYVLAHALWDSWLHERDILEPLGRHVPVERDELLACTWYGLALAGLQGGLLEDPEPVGPGLDEAVDVTVRFEDLPDDPLHVRFDRGVHLDRSSETGTPSGRALDLVEGYTGRVPLPDESPLPQPLADQLGRAHDVL